MATLSTTAWVLHELGLAAGFGGNLFGLLALNPAVATIQSKRERGKVTHLVWSRYKAVSGASLALMAGTWVAGRALRGGRDLDRTTRRLTVAKDILVAGALVGGVSAMVLGRRLDHEIATSNEPLTPTSRPSAETRGRVLRLQHVTDHLGRANLVLSAAILGLSTVLAMTSRQPSRGRLFLRRLVR